MRSISIVRTKKGHLACDVCGPAVAATRSDPGTPSREQANYCDDCYGRFTTWPESLRFKEA